MAAFEALATPFVLYLQEDMWLTDAARAMGPLLECAVRLLEAGEFDGIRLEGSAPVAAGLYHLEESGHQCEGQEVFRFAPNNRWLYSHQPAVWRRDFLLGSAHSSGGHEAVVARDENPWLSELLGSQRAAARQARVGLLVAEWYVAVSSSGQLSEEGAQTTNAELRAAKVAGADLIPPSSDNICVRRGAVQPVAY